VVVVVVVVVPKEEVDVPEVPMSLDSFILLRISKIESGAAAAAVVLVVVVAFVALEEKEVGTGDLDRDLVVVVVVVIIRRGVGGTVLASFFEWKEEEELCFRFGWKAECVGTRNKRRSRKRRIFFGRCRSRGWFD